MNYDGGLRLNISPMYNTQRLEDTVMLAGLRQSPKQINRQVLSSDQDRVADTETH